MNNNALAKEINDLLATERRSLLEHFLEATPHVDAATYRIWNAVKKMAHRDTDHVARLSGLLLSMQLPERTKPFSQDVGHYHFMGLEFVLSLLVDEKKKQLAKYDRALLHCAREAEVVGELESLRADNLSELLSLESMAAQLRKKTSTTVDLDMAMSPDLNNAANAVVAANVLAAAKAR